jgi:hypothetical protein
MGLFSLIDVLCSFPIQDMAAKVAESLGLLPFDVQADLGYMQHRSSLCVAAICVAPAFTA